MITSLYRDCPGCGVHLPRLEAHADGRYNASAECWQLYGEVSAYTLTRGGVEFIHQLAVDAYGAQHAGEDVKSITVAFALIGLYLAYERDYPGRQVQRVHMLLAQRAKVWPRFVLPSQAGIVTVLDVVRARPGEERDTMLRRWGQSVWDARSQEHERVRSLLASVMAD